MVNASGNKTFNSDARRVVTTKRQTTLLLGVIALLIIGSTGIGIFFYTASPSTTSSSTSSSTVSGTNQTTDSNGSGPFKVNYNTLVVGYNSGLWQLSIQDTSGKQIKELTAVLKTPTESEMCTGLGGGFSFNNCPATPSSAGAFPVNATFTGYASGVGAGSAKSGETYQVIFVAVYSDGTGLNQTVSVTATASG
jgi:hypothetical protein